MLTTACVTLQQLSASAFVLLVSAGLAAAAFLNGRILCASPTLGLNAQQQTVCAKFPQAMPFMSKGERNGLKECSEQMRNTRWRCHVVNPPIFSDKRLPKKLIGTREHAYLSAVLSAAIAAEVTRSCRHGSIPNCECSTATAGHWHFNESTRREEFQWGNCSDDPSFALKITKALVDAEEAYNKDHKIRMVNLHNNHVGRRMVNMLMKNYCTCWGLSGACTTKTCNRRIPLRMVKLRTMMSTRIKNATKVTVARTTPLSLISAGPGPSTRVLPDQLVFAKSSPKFCNVKSKRISPGIQGRQCIPNSNGLDGCKHLCCGHLYKSVFSRIIQRCNCVIKAGPGGYVRQRCGTCTKTVVHSECTAERANHRGLS